MFYCGHGAIGKDGKFYLVSYDAEIEASRIVPGSGVSDAELMEKLGALKAQRILLIFNTCYSGSISPTLGPGEPGLETISLSTDMASAILGTGSGRIIITASRENQKSYIGKGELSIFTQALVDGLHGKGVGNNAGYISAYNLYEYIYRMVTKEKGQEQEPELTMLKNRGPFAVALYKGASTLGEFDDSQKEVDTPAVHAVEEEDARWSFKQYIKVHDGAVAIGKGAKAVGKGGILIEGNVGGGAVVAGAIKVEIQMGQISPDPDALRVAYLNHLLESVSHLSLAGIDPKAASEAEARLSLSAVYTALLTNEVEDQGLADRRGKVQEPGREAHRLTALEQLNRQSRLVLLGDPGSGKTTFVNFVALCLAGEALGRSDANLELLTAPPPREDERQRSDKENKLQPQPWDHGVLLPIAIVLRDLAASGLPEASQPATAEHLWQFIASQLSAAALGDFAPYLRKELMESGCLLLLDGLDEVPEADRRRIQLKRAIEDFAATYHRCRILITSRTYAYQKQDWQLSGFKDTELAPFTRGQIETFVDRWYRHIAALRNLNLEDAHGRAELLKRAIFSSDRLPGLAERPLLLTLMASLHAWRGGSLPEKREQLYADTVDLLLDWWESPKAVRSAQGEVIIAQPSLAEWLHVDRDKVRMLLNELAFHAHASQAEMVGTADVPEGAVVSGLMRLAQNPDVNPARLMEYISQRAGLLIPRGVGVYTFPHRTFQEYLAACYLTDHGYPERVAELACADPDRWREVTLLAGAKAARGGAFALWSLVECLCSKEPEESKDLKFNSWGAHLAAQVVVESAILEGISDANRRKVDRVKRWLVHILAKSSLLALEHARAGDHLSILGETRREVITLDMMQFCWVPGGTFKWAAIKKRIRMHMMMNSHSTP